MMARIVTLVLLLAPQLAHAEVTIGSKNFSESRLLAELFAQAIEAQTELTVQRRFNLAGTAICFAAVQSGDIDLYPEYTGTGLVTLLEEPARRDPTEVLTHVRREFAHRFDLVWLAPLGFENSYEVAVRSDLASQHQLRSISDLVAVAPDLRAGFGYEFMEREDGLVGLRRVYGLEFDSIVGMQQSLKYEAAGAGRLDVLDVYTTDGLILVHDLVVLDDDRSVFPPYQAAALVNGSTLREHPEVSAALAPLAGTLSEPVMRQLNRRVEVDGQAIEAVAASFLAELGLGDAVESTASSTPDGGLWTYVRNNRSALVQRVGEHLVLVGVAMALGMLVAIPLGLWLEGQRSLAEPIIRAIGVLQTIPSIALLAFMIPLLGVGVVPAVAALFLYSLFPMVRNTYTGLCDADPAAVESGTALGMTRGQVLRQVRFPLATAVIWAGVRTSTVISVGTATLAAFIGAGGLGQPIVTGLQLNDTAIILSGAIPAALLALVLDALLGILARR